jgi:DNA-binding winged helix-turn-helix (wHTH) protein
MAPFGNSKAGQWYHENLPADERRKGHRMRTHTLTRNKPGCEESTFTGVEPSILQSKSRHFPTARGQHRRIVSRPQTAPRLRNEGAEIPTGIDGLSVPARLLIADLLAEAQSRFVSDETDLHSLLSTIVAKLIDTMGALPRQHRAPSKQALATAGLASSAEHSARLPPPNDTVLRVGPLELDLLDRTAKRGDRQIDLRPREFQLLKYFMQRSDTLLTRATLLMEVWSYKFVPETNLVDVYMSKLRRKVDGPNETALIRNVRGAGFVLSAAPFPKHSTPRTPEGATILPSDSSSRPKQGQCNCERSRRAQPRSRSALVS